MNALGHLLALSMPPRVPARGQKSLLPVGACRKRFPFLIDSSFQAQKCSFDLLQSHPCSAESLSAGERVCAGLAGRSWFPPHAPCRAPSWWGCSAERGGCGAPGPWGDPALAMLVRVGSRASQRGSQLLSPFPSSLMAQKTRTVLGRTMVCLQWHKGQGRAALGPAHRVSMMV